MTNNSKIQPKVVIVHDWLVGGGAEKVVLELHHMYPEAPIYTSYCTPEWREKLDKKVVTGYLQHFGKQRKFLPLLQYAWFRSLDLKDFNLVIVTTGNGMAKAVRPSKESTYICYCHTPVHYLWRHYETYMRQTGFGVFSPIARLGLKILAGPLRKLDYNAAQRPDYFIGNSTHISQDIKKYYNRDATPLFPPVDTERFTLPGKDRKGYISVGRLAPMKHNDIAVSACNDLGLPLTIIGGGPDLEKLKKMAGPTVRVLGKVSDKEVERELASASAFLFASYEDFGIAPIEAMAAGLPVIAYKVGGALDYVVPGVTGEFFAEQTIESLKTALKTFNPNKYDEKTIRHHAENFSNSNFRQNITNYISKKLAPTDTNK